MLYRILWTICVNRIASQFVQTNRTLFLSIFPFSLSRSHSLCHLFYLDSVCPCRRMWVQVKDKMTEEAHEKLTYNSRSRTKSHTHAHNERRISVVHQCEQYVDLPKRVTHCCSHCIRATKEQQRDREFVSFVRFFSSSVHTLLFVYLWNRYALQCREKISCWFS